MPCGPSIRHTSDRVATHRRRRAFLSWLSAAGLAPAAGVRGGLGLSLGLSSAVAAGSGTTAAWAQADSQGNPVTPAASPAITPAPTPSFSEEARRRLMPGDAGARDRFEHERRALLEQAERQLEAGEAEAALDTLDRAALMRHAADTELGLVRGMMAAGHYQRALAAAAHTAGAHRDQSAGSALYAWLLHLGGQEVFARRLLDEALRRAPTDALLQHAQAQLGEPWPRAGAPLRQRPWHAAPIAFTRAAADAPPATAQVLATACLLPGGEEALLARSAVAALPAGAPLWLRNGLGQTVAVAARRATADADLDLLVLRAPLPAPAWSFAAREPFAGSPGAMVEFAPDTTGAPAWPVLRQGFFAGLPGSLPDRPLGLAAPRGPRGGPVFDAHGRFAGMAVAAQAADTRSPAPDRLLALHRLRAASGRALPGAPTGPAPRVGPEVAYELALRGALQVLAPPRVPHA